MTEQQRVTVLWGPLDGEYVPAPGILVAAYYAMYVVKGSLWFDRVLPVTNTASSCITDKSSCPVMLSDNVPHDADYEDIIAKAYRMLTEMTAFDFVTRVLMETGVDVELFPLE